MLLLTITVSPAEQCLHVLWLIQLLSEPQTLCEVQRWQPAQWRPECVEGMLVELLQLLWLYYIRLTMIFFFCRAQVKNVSRTALVRDSPLLHVEPLLTAFSMVSAANVDIRLIAAFAHKEALVSDTLELYYIDNGTKTEIPLTKKGIAWWTDKHVKFRNPGGNNNLTAAFQGDLSHLCAL